MAFLRKSDGTGQILDEDGNLIATVTPAKGVGDAYEALAEKLENVLSDELPRVLITLKEGLLEDAQADIECQVLILEDDRFAEPKLAIRRRDIILGEPESVSSLLESAGKRNAKYLE